ncbi:MAG: histidinol dehydrogenase, partial [Aureibaculum sp.]
ILVSTSEEFLNKVEKELKEQVKPLPRKTIIEKALKNSKMIFLENDDLALELINNYAPEHFIICTKNEALYVKGIENAGSVFIGKYTPESAGDYASGTNHTLPTNGYAKQYSGVNLDSFLKSITFQKISKDGIKNIGNAIELMAEAEGLLAHKNAVTLRLNSLRDA